MPMKKACGCGCKNCHPVGSVSHIPRWTGAQRSIKQNTKAYHRPTRDTIRYPKHPKNTKEVLNLAKAIRIGEGTSPANALEKARFLLGLPI